MRGVHMESLTSATDAYRAALASLLELDLDDVPTYDGIAQAMQYDAWLGAKLNLVVWRAPMESTPLPIGYWLVRLKSTYQGFDVHTAVMLGGDVAWDPHPEGVLMGGDVEWAPFSAELFIPLDPAAPIGAEALRSA